MVVGDVTHGAGSVHIDKIMDKFSKKQELFFKDLVAESLCQVLKNQEILLWQIDERDDETTNASWDNQKLIEKWRQFLAKKKT